MIEVIVRTRRVDQVMDLLQELEGLEERHALDADPAKDRSRVEDVAFDRAQLEDLPLARSQPPETPHDDIEDFLGNRDLVDGRPKSPSPVPLFQHVLTR